MLFARPHSLLNYNLYPQSTFVIHRDRCLKAQESSDDEVAEESQRSKKRKSAIVYQSRHAEITNSDNSYVLSLDLPGVKESDIAIEAKDQNLHVTADRKDDNNKTTARFRQVFSFDKKSVNVSELEATLTDGVLTINLPKKEQIAAKTISVFDQEAPTTTGEPNNKHVAVTFDVPGVKATEISISFYDDVLSVRGQRRKGQSTIKIYRRIRLDEDKIDSNEFKAYLSSGVLTVVVPCKEESKTEGTLLSFSVSSGLKALANGNAGDEDVKLLSKEGTVVVETVTGDKDETSVVNKNDVKKD